MLHPSELRCTLLSYAAPPSPTELRLALNELRGPPIAASLFLPTKYICRENPAKFPETKWFSSGPNSGCQRRISFHWTKEALIYNIPRPSPHPSHPKKCNVPCHHTVAALILTAKLMICKENPAKISVWEKNPPKYNTLYSSIEQLQVAL